MKWGRFSEMQHSEAGIGGVEKTSKKEDVIYERSLKKISETHELRML